MFQPMFACEMPETFLAHADSRYAAFPAMILPAHRIWSSNPASDHTSKMDTVSHVSMSALRMHRGPAPNQATGVTMASKKCSLFLMETFRPRKIVLLTEEA